MCHVLQREDLGFPPVICKATERKSRTILGLQSHPQYSRDFDSISQCCEHIRIWRQACWSTKTADQCSDGSTPFHRPLSQSIPYEDLSDRLWSMRALANWPRLIPNSMDSVPLEAPTAHFLFPGCLSELVTCHCNLQREFTKGSCFLFFY